MQWPSGTPAEIGAIAYYHGSTQIAMGPAAIHPIAVP